MNIRDINKYIDSYEIKHIQVIADSIRINPSDNGEFLFTEVDGNTLSVKFTQQGIGCSQWFTRGHTEESKFLERLSYKNFTKIVRDITSETNPKLRRNVMGRLVSSWKLLMSIGFSQSETIFLHLSRDIVFGMTRQWSDMITNSDILSLIHESGYESKICSYGMTNKSFYVDLMVSGSDRFVIRINNGYTGHETLKYSVVARIGTKLDFVTDITGKARHLSNLRNVFMKLDKTFDEARDKNLVEALEGISASACVSDIRKLVRERMSVPAHLKRGDWRLKLKNMNETQIMKVEGDHLAGNYGLIGHVSKMKAPESGLAVVNKLLRYGHSTRGYKSASEILVNAYLQTVWENL